MTRAERQLGALWGSLAGDALGVPVEFQSRAEVQRNPVRGMRGFGTHNQPPGTWSDDSSLLLCAVESLAERGEFDAADLGRRFVRWQREGLWTPHGRVFDIGIATAGALSRLAGGIAPEQAGGADEYSNGNGSLMRIVPFALWCERDSAAALDALVRRASALTHRHPRSQMACAFYCLLVRELLAGQTAEAAWRAARNSFAELCASPSYTAERAHFHLLEGDDLASRPERDIASSGYVVDTLTASVWCLLTSRSFAEAVLKAVNLGGDTDTTGTVTGGLAGALYGMDSIPAEWRKTLARHNEINALFTRFLAALP